MPRQRLDVKLDQQGPRAKDGALTQKRKLTKDLNRGLREDVVGEVGTDQASDVAAQRRIVTTENLFQGSPVARLGQENEEGLVTGCGSFGLGVACIFERGVELDKVRYSANKCIWASAYLF
jgi:hypothetical protein